MSKSKAYIAIDVHARNCVLGWRNGRGVFQGKVHHETSEAELIKAVEAVPSGNKLVTVEESTLASWVARTLRPYVAEVVICDPRSNKAILQNPQKNDERDVEELSRLLWLGQLCGVYHAQEDDRAVFKTLVQQYLDLRDEQVRLKLKLKAKFHLWGITQVGGHKVYAEDHREEFVGKIKDDSIRRQMKRIYVLLDQALALEADAFKEVVARGHRYPEIAEFTKIPGVGPVGSHVFDAYIQTPNRFDSAPKVWRYCQLAVTDRSSDGKPLGFRRLDTHGNPELKAMSYWAWKGALHMNRDNEVKRFYYASLARTHDKTHARLNTQRKIIATMWVLWKNKEEYRPERFLSPADATDR